MHFTQAHDTHSKSTMKGCTDTFKRAKKLIEAASLLKHSHELSSIEALDLDFDCSSSEYRLLPQCVPDWIVRLSIFMVVDSQASG